MLLKRNAHLALLALLILLAAPLRIFGQVDQGTITGVVQDPSGAVIGNAGVTLTNVDEGQVLNSKSDGAGVYVFSPIKIGNYTVSASAPGFETTTQTHLKLSIQQRLNVVVVLKPGSTTETVTVTTDAPLMQTQESSVGQTMDTETINSVPLNGRNWVYIAQLSAGTAVADGSRGGGKGDFEANGQRAEENNFVLDGVDNNANVVDFYNGASFVVNPPPDALAEFKVQTSDYSAEFGHSSGAVINASIKAGANALHGSAWEYVRNTAFDTHDWNPNGFQPVPAYHDNQFGATLGGPFLKNKLFFFGDAQATRIAYSEPGTFSVPTALMRQGDFSELLNTSITGYSEPVQLYHQSSSAAPVAFTNNCLVTSSACTSNVTGVTLNPTALAMMNYYPAPNTNGTLAYNNYLNERPVIDNTFQWDARMDYTLSSKDSAYSRYSYGNEVGHNSPPLGNILDGGGFGDDGKQKTYSANFMFSETHVFTQTLTNEARFGFNYLHTGFQAPNAADTGFEAANGFGGIPVGPLNGGLPGVSLNSLQSNFGTPGWSPTNEHENVFQIIDNITKIWGNHSLKAGVSFQNIRFSTLQPQNSRGSYNYTGKYTANVSGGATVVNTGYGVADFLLDQQNSAGLSNEVTNGDQRSNNGAYAQDDWRIKQNLTINLGLRWEFFQPYGDVGGYQASFVPTPGSYSFSPTATCSNPSSTPANAGCGTGSGNYYIPKQTWSYAQSVMGSASYNPNYDTVLGWDNISPTAVSDPHIAQAQKTNFAPRVGAAWSPDGKTSVRVGFGIFYGGLESVGYYPNLGENYPFQISANFPAGSCATTSCPTDGISIANGFTSIVANGFASATTNLSMRGEEQNPKTPYTESWNASIERSINNDMVATASYVGNTGRHILTIVNPNSALVLAAHGQGSQNQDPFPHSSGMEYVVNAGMSDYNALQTKLEKRMAHGYNLLATYTWSHSLDDVDTPLGSTGDSGQVEYNLVPMSFDYSQSPWDTRHRLTFNGLYQLPFGRGRAYLNNNSVLDAVVGGWSANALFTAQTGNFFTVYPSNLTSPDNISTRAVKTGNPYSTGGTPGFSAQECASSVRNATHWYNACAFTNPWDSSSTGSHPLATGSFDSSRADAEAYAGGRRNQIAGPGYERVNMSIFKSFTVFRENKVDFRADVFNLLNTPALANPSNTGIGGGNVGQITGTRSLQKNAPDSRFFQLSAHYAF
jgi:hypothetical protein